MMFPMSVEFMFDVTVDLVFVIFSIFGDTCVRESKNSQVDWFCS